MYHIVRSYVLLYTENEEETKCFNHETDNFISENSQN